MKRFMISLLLAAAGFGVPEASNATPVPGYACHGCSLAQEEQAALAKPGLGIRFIYNFTNNRLRKFIVVLDSARAASAIDGVFVTKEPADYSRASPSSRELYEMAVDAGVVPIFAAAVNLWRKDPSWFTNKVQRIAIDRVGVTQGDIAPREFSPRNVAWDGPISGEGIQFTDRVSLLLEGPYGTSQMSPELSELLHGVAFAMQSVTIEGNSAGEINVGMTWGGTPPKEIMLDFCNSRNECVRLKLTTNPYKLELVGARDSQDQAYPANTETAVNRNYPNSPAGREAAGDMGRFVSGRREGTFIGGNVAPNCGRIGLACSDIGSAYTCRTFCWR